jgi:hypothetical protein
VRGRVLEDCFASVHYDSASSKKNAKVAGQLGTELLGSKHVVSRGKCARQDNGHDCGVYVLFFTEILARAYVDSPSWFAFQLSRKWKEQLESVTPRQISAYRSMLRQKYKKLLEQQRGAGPRLSVDDLQVVLDASQCKMPGPLKSKLLDELNARPTQQREAVLQSWGMVSGSVSFGGGQGSQVVVRSQEGEEDPDACQHCGWFLLGGGGHYNCLNPTCAKSIRSEPRFGGVDGLAKQKEAKAKAKAKAKQTAKDKGEGGKAKDEDKGEVDGLTKEKEAKPKAKAKENTKAKAKAKAKARCGDRGLVSRLLHGATGRQTGGEKGQVL